jgi:hypothetical protein
VPRFKILKYIELSSNAISVAVFGPRMVVDGFPMSLRTPVIWQTAIRRAVAALIAARQMWRTHGPHCDFRSRLLGGSGARKRNGRCRRHKNQISHSMLHPVPSLYQNTKHRRPAAIRNLCGVRTVRPVGRFSSLCGSYDNADRAISNSYAPASTFAPAQRDFIARDRLYE